MYASLHTVFMWCNIRFLRFIHVVKYSFSSFVLTAACLDLTLQLKRRSVSPECALLFLQLQTYLQVILKPRESHLAFSFKSHLAFSSVLCDLVQASLHCETHTSSFNGFPLSTEHTVNAIIFLDLSLTRIQTPFSARDRLEAGIPGTPVHASIKNL